MRCNEESKYYILCALHCCNLNQVAPSHQTYEVLYRYTLVSFKRYTFVWTANTCRFHPRAPGPRLNMKKPSYRFRNSQVRDKTVSRTSYLQHRNAHTWGRRNLYWGAALVLKWLAANWTEWDGTNKIASMMAAMIAWLLSIPLYSRITEHTRTCLVKRWSLVLQYSKPCPFCVSACVSNLSSSWWHCV